MNVLFLAFATLFGLACLAVGWVVGERRGYNEGVETGVNMTSARAFDPSDIAGA